MIILTPFSSEYEIAKARFGFEHEVVWLGVGPRNALKTLMDMGVSRDTPMMLFGFAGSNFLPVWSEVYVTRSYLHQFNVSYDDPPVFLEKPAIKGAPENGYPCYSSSDFVVETKVIEPAIFDMELGFLTPYFSNISCWRIVSDNLDLKGFNDFVENSDKIRK